jgi:DNA-binding transcriptional MerR regulator
MYSLRQTADLLDIHPRTLRRWIATGSVREAVQVVTKHGPAWRIPEEALAHLKHRANYAAGPEPPPIPEHATEAEGVPLPEAAQIADPVLPWSQVQRMLETERSHWQRLSDLQAETMAGMRHALNAQIREVERLRRQLEDTDKRAASVRMTQPVGEYTGVRANSTTG